MANVRLVVRRSRDHRCPLCRGDLRAHGRDVAACPGCGTLAHEDCVRELGRGVCPTLGCGARPRGTRAAPEPVRDDGVLPWQRERHGPRPLWARFGPYAWLAVATIVALAATATGVVLPVATLVQATSKAGMPLGAVVVMLILSVITCALGARWFQRLPAAHALLAGLGERRGRPFRFSVVRDGSGEDRRTRFVLEAPTGVRFDVTPSTITAPWVYVLPARTPVLLHGGGPDDPLILETERGALSFLRA